MAQGRGCTVRCKSPPLRIFTSALVEWSGGLRIAEKAPREGFGTGPQVLWVGFRLRVWKEKT